MAASTIRLEVPARPAFLGLLRVTAAAAIADAAAFPDLDDVRLAIDELAAGAIADAPPDEVLRVDIDVRPGELVVRGRLRAGARTPSLSTIGRQLVSTVCADHTLGRDRDDIVFDFTMAVGAPGRTDR